MADRGMSEALGFVFVFSLIVSSVGVVYVVGFDGLESARDYEQVNNAERAFTVLAENVEDVTWGGAPHRATEIKLADAELRFGDPVAFNVTVEKGESSTRYNGTFRPFVYDASTGERLVYANGAVFRERDGSGVMVRDPPFLLERDRTVLPVVSTGIDGPSASSGSGTVLVRANRQQRFVPVHNVSGRNGEFNVTVSVTSSRAEAWKRYFEDEVDGPASCTGPVDGTVTCEFQTRRIAVTEYGVGLSVS